MKNEILLDASSLKMLVCDRLYQFRVCYGLQVARNPEAAFGSAFHKYCELKVKGLEEEAQLHMLSYKGSEQSLFMMACTEFESVTLPPPIALGTGIPCCEIRFKVPYATLSDGCVVYLCGTLDRVGISEEGILEVIDYKTTRKWDKSKFFSEYFHDFQMLFYYWVLCKYGQYILPVEYADLAFNRKHSIRILGVFLTKKPIEFELGPSITFVPEYLNEFSKLLTELVETKIKDIWTLFRTNLAAAPTGIVANKCPSCEFNIFCRFSNFSSALCLDSKPYDPMTHGL